MSIDRGARVRLAVVSNTLDAGGAERFTSTFVRHVDGRRFETHVVLFEPRLGFPIPDGLPVHVLGPRSNEHFHRVWGLAGVLRQISPDVVLSVHGGVGVFVGLALKLLRPRPRWVSRLSLNCFAPETGLFKRLMRDVLVDADATFANSVGVSESFTRKFGTRQRPEVIYNPVEIPSRARGAVGGSAGRPPTVVTLGRLSPQKRHDLVIDCFERVVAVVRGCQLTMIGDGPERAELETLVAQRRLTASVRFAGYLDDPFDELLKADVFLLASDYEGLPNALLEAQAVGLPAVATDCPDGPSEVIVDGETGRLVPVGDADAMAAAILELLEDEGKRKRWGTAARRRVEERFSTGELVPSIEELLWPSGDASPGRRDGD